MGIFTKLARDIFASTDGGGNARQVDNGEAAIWGTELENSVSISMAEVIKTANYTVLTTDKNSTLIANSATAIAFTLPAAATAGDGWKIAVKNIGAGDLTLTQSGAETIDGISSLVLSSGDSCIIASNGTAWRTYLKARGSVAIVADMAALAAIDTTTDTLVYLEENGREGMFAWTSGDLSAYVTVDTLQGIYVPPAADVTGASGSWVRQYDGVINIAWFGAKNDAGTDAQPSIQCAIDIAVTIGSSITEGPVGKIYGAPGRYQLGSSLILPKSIDFCIDGTLLYTPTTGSAVIVTDSLEAQHNFYQIFIGGVRAVNGNTTIPTTINMAGCVGVEIRLAQFSNIHVGQVIAFTKYGVWLNSSNDQFTGQHIQDNDLAVDQIAYCGAGLHAESVSAADGAIQVNTIRVENSFSNFQNVNLGVAGDINTNHNICTFNAIDAPGAGGYEISIVGLYNIVTVGFIDTGGSISFGSGSASNRVTVGRNKADVIYSDAGTANRITYADGYSSGQFAFSTTATSDEPIVAESSDAGSTYAQLVQLYRNSASPAASDGGVGITAYFNDDAGSKTLGGSIHTDMPTVANGNENMRWLFDTIVGGGYGTRMTLWQGLILGSPTNGDKGVGTINLAGDIYKNDSAFTNPDYVFEKAYTGQIVKFADNPGAAAYAGCMSIDEIERVTRETFRLPGFDDQSAGMFERGDRLLEKIEEVYLCIFDLNRRLRSLEAGGVADLEMQEQTQNQRTQKK